jgi:osmoprotectant transport system substrate-binding protein
MGHMHSRARSRILAGALAFGIGLTATACGSVPVDPDNTGAGTRITVGAQDSLENRIIAQLYGQVLADHGYLVDYNEGIGPRENFLAALQAGTIDLIADNSGDLLYGIDPKAFARSAEDIAEALPEQVEALGLGVLDAAPADNAEAFVVSQEFAEAHQVASIGELGYLARSITLGVSDDFESHRYGTSGLLAVYGVTGFSTKTINDGGGTATVSDLLTNAIQVAVIPSTSPSISRNNLRVLGDPKSLITTQNIVPVVGEVADSADVRRLLDPVSEALTTDELRSLNERGTSTDTPSPERIAKKWLAQKKLLDD